MSRESYRKTLINEEIYTIDTDNFKRITGNRIYELRHSMELSRERFAEICGISPSFLSDVERGLKSITVITLYKICRAFNVSADYFVLGNEADYQNDVALELLNSFTPEQKDMLIKIMSDVKQMAEIKK